MKYDIAKNEDGPLRRTVKGADGREAKGTEKLSPLTDDAPSELQPAMDERLRNIELHTAIRYGNVSYFFPNFRPLMVAEIKYPDHHVPCLRVCSFWKTISYN